MSEPHPVHSVSEHAEDQLRFLVDRVREGGRCALITIVDVVETASRGIGTHMVVAQDGAYAGSVSSGCIDASVASFALDAMRTGERRRVRLGAGSSYFDLQLPCGGGVDLLIIPDPDVEPISELINRLHSRRAGALRIAEHALEFSPSAAANPVELCGTELLFSYFPKPRLLLAGRGSELTVFVRLAVSCGFDVHAYSPDEIDVDSCRALGARAHRLESASSKPQLPSDPWTAAVLLFHDHDWEPGILRALLEGDAFYIGALGSPRTHASRLETLRRMGVDEQQLERITGPIGLVPSMRNATTLAISALAEIVERRRQALAEADMKASGEEKVSRLVPRGM